MFSLRRSLVNTIFKQKAKNHFSLPYVKQNVSFIFHCKKRFLENYKVNTYDGITLDIPKTAKYEITKVPKQIQESLDLWVNKKNYTSATISIPAEVSELISHFIAKGFYLHHTIGNNVVICKWLHKNVPNKIPNYAHHYVGIGAIIINKKFEVLMVKERHYYYLVNNQKPWKFITGMVEEGETIENATLREVREEIGLTNVNFVGNLVVRDIYPNNTGKGDICYFNICSVDEENSNSKISFPDDEVIDKHYFTMLKLKEMENEITEITAFSLQRIRKNLEAYKISQEHTLDENVFDILPKICRPPIATNKSKLFDRAIAF